MKTKVAVIFGGKSAEHEVSLQSAKNVIAALDKTKYDVILIGIDKRGKWHLNEKSKFLLDENSPQLIRLNKSNDEVILIPDGASNQLLNIRKNEVVDKIDVVFPVLHGPYGEDGTIQGMLKLANVPFVGAGVLGSAVGMDKDVTKRLLRDAGIPVAKFLSFTKQTIGRTAYSRIVEDLGSPFFLKPANLGSSVGVSKIHDRNEFEKGANEAFAYDRKILAEEYIRGREIECSVLGNEDPIASIPGEVIPNDEFYSYNAKYIDENGAILEIPAKLDRDVVKKVQDTAVQAFKTLCCEGMARADFFVKRSGDVFLNEINTIPGFTRISMYPKLWEASGISYAELVDRLIRLAVARHHEEQALRNDYQPDKP